MPTADERLQALFAADVPPPRDPVFTAQVFERLARRALLLDLAWLAGACLIGGVVLWRVWPHLSGVLESLALGLAPAAIVGSLALLLAVAASGRLWPSRA